MERRCRGQFKILSQHLPGGTEENTKTLSQDSRPPGLVSMSETPEYETGVLTTRARHSVTSMM
jgi:hypothetical protein